jgi:hypothetical protein
MVLAAFIAATAVAGAAPHTPFEPGLRAPPGLLIEGRYAPEPVLRLVPVEPLNVVPNGPDAPAMIGS